MGISVIQTGEFVEDMVSPDVLTVDSRTGSSTLIGAPVTNGRLFLAVAKDAGGSKEFRDLEPLTGRNGWWSLDWGSQDTPGEPRFR